MDRLHRLRTWIDAGLIGLGALAALAALAGALIERPDTITLLFTCFFLTGFAGCGLLLFLGRSRWLAYPGALSSLGGLLVTSWPRTMMSDEWSLALMFLATTFCTYSGIMHAVAREGRWIALLRWPATACGAILCVGLATILLDLSGTRWLEQSMAVTAALAAGLAFLVIPLRLREKRRNETALETTGAIVSLRCPRCDEAQELRAGRRRCRRCRLVIALAFEEPRCAGCGFALFKLTGDRCPECGREIPQEERWSAAA